MLVSVAAWAWFFEDGFMRTYIWQDGRVLGFDAVEWLAWVAALNVLALITLVI